MCRQVALHIDKNRQRQRHIAKKLRPLHIDLHSAQSLNETYEIIQERPYDLILINHEIVGNNIVDFCSHIRSNDVYTLLIAMLKKHNPDLEEKLFDIGFEDVIAERQLKSNALAKRINTRLKRARVIHGSTQRIRLKNALIDFDRQEIRCNGEVRKITGLLPDLLRYFIDNPGRIISREELLNSHIWSDSICSAPSEGGNTFDVYMGKLRKLIEPDPLIPQIIVAVRGKGWMLSKDVIM